MNSGLKQYNKYLTKTIDNAGKAYVNLFKDDSNIHLVLPVLKTTGNGQIDLSLIYNYQDKNVSDIFGKGFRLNLYSKLSVSGSTASIVNADGSTDTYTLGTMNKETLLTVNEVDEGYEVVDKYNNIKLYDNNSSYPKSIVNSNEDEYTIDFTSTTKTISNNYDESVRFILSNSRVSSIIYSRNNQDYITISLSYENDRLTNISYKELGSEVNNTIISYDDSYIILKDNKTKYGMKFNISNNLVTEISDGYNDSYLTWYSIEMSSYKTKVTNTRLNNYTYLIYDEDTNLLAYELDKFGNVLTYTYDTDSKQILSNSNKLNLRDIDNNILGDFDISSFNNNNGLTETYISVTDEVVKDFVDRCVRYSGSGTISKNINSNSIDTDTYTGIAIVKLNSGTAQIKLGTKSKDLSITSLYQVVVIGYGESGTSRSIDISFELDNASIDICYISVMKKEFGNFYEYDEDYNVTKIDNGVTSQEVSYESNKVSDSIGEDSSNYEVSYDDCDNITEIRSAYGVKIENTYDTTYKNNLIKSITKDKNESKILEIEKTYTSDGKYVKEESDELGNKTYYSYDDFGKIKQVTDSLGYITNVNYFDNSNIKDITSGNLSASYTYDSYNRIESISISNGGIYKFSYDNRSNITEIKLNDNIIFEYEYDLNTGNIIKQKYGNEYYLFSYDSDNLIEDISYYKDDTLTNTYHYEYDSSKRVKRISLNGALLEEYSYDGNGTISNIKTCDSDISGIYDDLGNLTIERRVVDDTSIVQTYDSLSRSKGSYPSVLEEIYSSDSQIAVAKFDYDSEKFKYYDGVIPYFSNSKSAKYQIELNYKSYYVDDSGFICFWFKPTNVTGRSDTYTLFSCQNSKNSSLINVTIEDSHLSLKVIDENGTAYNLGTSTQEVNYSKWNFFALNFMNRDDGLGYADVCEYNLYLNGEVIKYTKQDPRIYVSTDNYPLYNIGYNPNDEDAYFRGYVTSIIISRHRYLTTTKIREMYRTTKDYLVDNAIIESGKVNGVDFSQTNVFNTDKFDDLIPLENSVTSVKGLRPIGFKRRVVSTKDKDRTFNFNKDSKRYAYVADGSTLTYDFDFSSDWTIMARVYTDTTTDMQYIFDFRDSSNTSNYIALYRNGTTNRLYLNVCGNKYNTGLAMENYTWYTIALSHKETLNYNSTDSECVSCRVYLDGSTYERSVYVSSILSSPKLYVGKSYSGVSTTSNFGSYTDYYPLYGQIEMLGIRNAYCETTTLDTMAKELNSLTKINLYDDLGMLKKKEVLIGDDELLSNTYTYKTRTNSKYISKLVASEEIKTNGNTLTTRKYSLDALGNVTSITDSYFGNKSYTYDRNGFLIKEDNTIYSYDYNGNILSNGDTTYTYDSLIKDRLVKVGNKEITYDTNNILNPISYDNNTYTYEGRRLTKFNNVTYTYDVEGKRISKNNNGYITKYYYSSDRLITEINDDYRLDFIYDENSQLIGFIYDNIKYLYVRDILQNILGIVDNNGEVVVKYECSGFGEITSITGSMASTIGVYNPFRYKGYYYDTESGMYYCKSRYYVPEWCRWLNADSPSYLEPTNLSGLNLFVYCGNNPISYSDESANTPSWVGYLLFAVGCAVVVAAAVVALTAGSAVVATAAVGALAGGLAVGSTSLVMQGITQGVDHINYGEIGIQMIFGAFSGAVGALTNGLVSFGVASIISGVSSFFTSMYNGESLGNCLKNGLKSAIFSLVFSFARTIYDGETGNFLYDSITNESSTVDDFLYGMIENIVENIKDKFEELVRAIF